MIYIENDSVNPYYNLALEEYFLDGGAPGDILLLWQNDNTVVVGRYQNTAQETDERFCRENNIKIVRRNTGGGAVYHDLGNLNFSVITDYKQGDDISYGRFLSVIVETLKKLGVDSQFRGRNDLFAGGRKISGSAQAVRAGRILHHGTLLCSTDLDMLSGALRNDPAKYDPKAIPSIRAFVANIRDFNNTITVSMLKSRLLSEYGGRAPLEKHELTETETAGIRLLQKSKYETWQWNYGESPAVSRKE